MNHIEFEPQRLSEESVCALSEQLAADKESEDREVRLQAIALSIAARLPLLQRDMQISLVAEAIAGQLSCPEIKDEIIKYHRSIVEQTLVELIMSAYYEVIEEDAALNAERNRPKHQATSS
jgi:hypothetical protein